MANDQDEPPNEMSAMITDQLDIADTYNDDDNVDYFHENCISTLQAVQASVHESPSSNSTSSSGFAPSIASDLVV